MSDEHANPAVSWPKSYLLQVYSRAVAEGCVRIPLNSRKAYQSFAQALYRLRRRSDAQHAAFILPEYHLVTCSWEPERGTCLVTFDALPDGAELPPILSVADMGERTAPPPARQAPREREEAPPVDIDQLVGDIVEAAGRKLDNSDD